VNIPNELKDILTSNPEVVSGAVCFKGTRVPVEIFFDYISTGYTLDRFLHGFPSVSRHQAMAVLDWQSKESKKSIGLELVA